MERSTIFNGKIHYKWRFSIAMLVHQRVDKMVIWLDSMIRGLADRGQGDGHHLWWRIPQMFRRLNQENWRSAKKTLATCFSPIWSKEKNQVCWNAISPLSSSVKPGDARREWVKSLGPFKTWPIGWSWFCQIMSSRGFRKALELTYIRH